MRRAILLLLALLCGACATADRAVTWTAVGLLAAASPSTIEPLAVAEERFSNWLVDLSPTREKCRAAYGGLLAQPAYRAHYVKLGTLGYERFRGDWPAVALEDYEPFCASFPEGAR